MSFFKKVFDGDDRTAPAHVEHTFTEQDASIISTVEPELLKEHDSPRNPFTDYIKKVVRFGAPPDSEVLYAPELTHEHPSVVWTTEDAVDADTVREDYEAGAELVAPESEERPIEVAPLAEELPQPSAALIPATTSVPGVVQASSTTQKSDVQVQRIVDGLFDRMRVVWGNEGRSASVAPAVVPPSVPAVVPTQYSLAESKGEIARLIRSEVPQAIKRELVAVFRTEIMKAIRAEISRVVREEFEEFERMMQKQMERLHAIEARLAKIEGTVGQEVKINFPKGAVQIDAPVNVTVPEREVKVAAPINVQPPSVVFDEGAINVTFNKSAAPKKEVHFERDPHDNSIKSAEIIDVIPEK